MTKNSVAQLTKRVFNRSTVNKTSLDSGVYIYWSDQDEPLYVGKALRLKNRLKNYLATDLDPKTAQLVFEAKKFSTIRVTSELEALLLEAKLVRKLQPPFNIQLKDDKHPLYIRITKETYPQVLTARKIDEKQKNIAFFGPFPSATNVYGVLRLLRGIFPFAQHNLGKRACLYSQIGLCDPCPNDIDKAKNKNELRKKYVKNIRSIQKILSGKITWVKNDLQKKMAIHSKKQEFEQALAIRNQIDRLNYITQPITRVGEFLKNPNLVEDIRQNELKQIKELLEPHLKMPDTIVRIECFDVAHLAGVAPTASMVTFINAQADKTYYRHFKIRQPKKQSDFDSIYEVARRRRKHLASWGTPDLVVVDGGKPQVAAFRKAFSLIDIPIVGLAKRYETLVIPTKTGDYVQLRLKAGPALNLLQRLRDEAHRFARRLHHKHLQTQLLAAN